jgi:hypothetical protein
LGDEAIINAEDQYLSVVPQPVQATLRNSAINLALFGPFVWCIWEVSREWKHVGLTELYPLWPLAGAILIVLVLYGIYRVAFPSAPKRHWLFMAGAVALGFGGTRVIFLDTLAWPYSATEFFLAQCLAGFGVYRLVMRTADQRRKSIAVTVAACLAVVLPLHILFAYSALTRLPCCPKDPSLRLLWRQGSGTHATPPLNKLFNVPYISGCIDCL